MRALGKVAAAEQMRDGLAGVVGLLLEPVEVRASSKDQLEAMAGAEMAPVQRLKPLGDMATVHRINGERLRIEPHVELTQRRTVGGDSRRFMGRLERLRELQGLWRKVEKMSSGAEVGPDTSRIERQEFARVNPAEVAKESPAMPSASMKFLRREKRREKLLNFAGLELQNGSAGPP